MDKIIEGIKEELKNLSDVDFQRRSWFALSSQEVSSPIEEINRLFDDRDFMGWVEVNRETVGHFFCEYAEELNQNVSDINLDQSHLSVFASPEWQSIRMKASVLLAMLEQVKFTE